MADVLQTALGSTLNGLTCTATLDAPATAGNVLLAVMTNNRGASNAQVPGGFTEVGRESVSGASNCTVAVRVAAGGETAVTYTATLGNSRMLLTVLELTGVDVAAGLPADSGYSSVTAATSYTTPALTGTGLDVAVLSLGTDAGNPVVWGGWSNGFTTRSAHNSAAGSNNVAQSVATKVAAGTEQPSQGWVTPLNASGGLLRFAAAGGGGGTVTAELSGLGTLSATVESGPTPAAFTGSGTLSATATKVSVAVATLSGSGTLSATSTYVYVPPQRVTSHEWAMFARDTDFNPSVALPIISAQIVVRHMGVGRAIVTTTYTAERWAALQPGRGVIVYRDGVVRFTGPVEDVGVDWDAESGRAIITAACASDEAVLADRMVFPDPLRAADDQTVSDYWRYTGVASTAMWQLISDQAGPTCRADRQVPGLTLGADPAVGQSRTWSTLFTRDGNLLQRLGLMSRVSGVDLGVRVLGAAGSLTVDVVQPRPLADSVRFSPDLSNLVGFSYRNVAPTVTHALSAGQGDLKLRVRELAVTTDPLALEWARQRWAYIDRRDTADLAELAKASEDALAEGGPTVDLSVTLTDSEAATFGRDWDLGDRVTVYVGMPGEPVTTVADVVREIAFTVTEDGAEKITPAIGTADATALPKPPTQQRLREVGLGLASLVSNK